MKPASVWAPFSVLTLLIFLYSTDLLNGDGAYLHSVLNDAGDLFDYAHFVFHKLNHLLAFALLGLFTFPLRKHGRDQGRRRAFWCCAAVALGSEMFQLLFDSRRPQVRDVALNLGASILGLHLLFSPPALLRLATERARAIGQSLLRLQKRYA